MRTDKSGRDDFFLVLLETSGNQKSIFQTNRLPENIGGSELIRRACTRHALEAVSADAASDHPDDISAFILDRSRNKPIEDAGPDGAEIVIATSGKALLLTRSRESAESAISAAVWSASIDAPGIIVRGAYVKIPKWSSGQDGECSGRQFHEQVKAVHHRAAALGATLPSPDLRFARLPFVEECRSSGLPAALVDWRSPNKDAVARPVMAKRDCRKAARERLAKTLDGVTLDESIDDLEANDPGWLAIVHADGNGLGEIFLDFANRSGAETARDYIDQYRKFSLAVDLCARRAVVEAVKKTWPNRKDDAPLAPAILGGDDLTVICEGAGAVAFAAHYLAAFEAGTGAGADFDKIVPRIAGAEGGPGRLAAAAGVAIMKPHFPFHRAYDIAEALTKSAKKTKDVVKDRNGRSFPCSALDFQVIFDASGEDLGLIRNRMSPGGDVALTARPYVVTPLDMLEGANGLDWAKRRQYQPNPNARSLRRAVDALKPKPLDADAPLDGLPRSQQHALHDALFMGRDVAESRLKAIKHRYPGFDWGAVLTDGALFFSEPDPAEPAGAAKTTHRAYLLDAMELADLEAEGGRSRTETP